MDFYFLKQYRIDSECKDRLDVVDCLCIKQGDLLVSIYPEGFDIALNLNKIKLTEYTPSIMHGSLVYGDCIYLYLIQRIGKNYYFFKGE